MFTVIIHYALLFARAIIACSIMLPFLLYLLFLARKIIKKHLPVGEELAEEKDYAIIIFARDKTQALQPLLHSLRQLNYTNYLVYVVMNNSNNTNFNFNSDKVIVLRTAQAFNNEFRLHRFAIQNLKRPHTHLTFLDSGCLVNSEYLNSLNAYFNQGYQAVQSSYALKKIRRLADVFYAIENVYNQVFKSDVLFALGSSASLASCGSAFTISLFKQCLQSANAMGASFSAALQNIIIGKGHQIAFASNAMVCYVNTKHRQQVATQKESGIRAWKEQFINTARLIYNATLLVNVNQFLFGMLLLQPSLFTSFVTAFFCMMISVCIHPAAVTFWMYCALLIASCFGIAFLHVKLNYRKRNVLFTTDHSFTFRLPNFYEEEREEMYNTAQAF